MNGLSLSLAFVGLLALMGTRAGHDLDLAAHQRMFGHRARCVLPPRRTA